MLIYEPFGHFVKKDEVLVYASEALNIMHTCGAVLSGFDLINCRNA